MTDLRIKEAVRYLGYGNHAADERTLALIEDSFRELEEKVQAKSVCRVFELTDLQPDGQIQIENVTIESSSLSKNLEGCREAVLLGATLGAQVDLLMKRYSVTDMARAVVWQACAAAYLEEYCDNLQAKIGEEMKAQGKWIRPRFSPGYGDFDIRHQEDILRMLEAPKKIGLTRTESYMLTPTKSVTAVIGISSQKDTNCKKGCEACGKKDCVYRRSQ